MIRHEVLARPTLRWIALACSLAALEGCSSMSAQQQQAAAMAAHQQAMAAAATAAGIATLPAFELITRGAERQDGLLPIWRKQDKIWLELNPKTTLERPFFLSPKLASGIGEAGVYGGLMQSRWAPVGRPQWVTFHKSQQQIQLLAINAAYTAQTDTPQAKAVQAAFSPSLLSSAPISSAPHPQTGAVLVEISPLLLGDLLGIGAQLQRVYRQGYGLDVRNSAIHQAHVSTDSAVFEVSQHFATSAISLPGAGGQPPGTPAPSTPSTLPDARSMFVNVHYTLTPLPDKPMKTREADARVGYFTTTITDFTDDLARTPRQRFINRWRLEKKDPKAAQSDPVKPIVFWLDPSIPEAYRPAITEGILEWNKAFAAIGYTHAIEVKTPPADKPFDTLKTGHAAIRWMTNAQPSFGAIGPTHVDPRTGEILDANIALESLSSRAIRAVRAQMLNPVKSEGLATHAEHEHHTDHVDESCQHGQYAAEQLGLALDVLEAQGVLEPDSPQVKEFVLAYLKDTTMHEVGHTLGLRHNFRASRWHSPEELRHPLLTKEKGNSASVMEYAPINLPAPGESAGAPFQTTLGPYDYWAIEYGYSDLPDDRAKAAETLQTIAQRSSDPKWADALAFGTDEDNALGLDPQSVTFDLGNDPIAFARTRVAIVRDLIERQSHRQLTAKDDPTLLRRSVSYALRDLARNGQLLMRQIGGLITRRDGPASGRDLLEPVDQAVQRAALQMLLKDFVSVDAVHIPASLQRKLAPDYLERSDADGPGLGATDFSVAEQLLAMQRGILNYLMSDDLAERLLDNADKLQDRKVRPLTVAEMAQQVSDAVWARPSRTADSASWQRNLQREHVNRLALAVVRPAGDRADTRAVMRQQAQQLLKRLRGMGASADATEQAHRQDCIDTLTQALQATMVRSGL